MTATEIIRDIVNKQGIKMSTLASRMGIGVNVLNERVRSRNKTIEKLDSMLRPMDYKILIVPVNRRAKEDEYEVEI